MRQIARQARFYLFVAVLAAAGWLISPRGADSDGLAGAEGSATARVESEFDGGTLVFERNDGQADSSVRFLSRSRRYSAQFHANEVRLTSSADAESEQAPARLSLANSNPSPTLRGLDRLDSVTNYYKGDAPEKWLTRIPHYRGVVYDEVYPGIDWVWYGSRQSLEFDFRVAPGADPGQAELAFHGSDAVRLDDDGDLLVEAHGRRMRYRRPVIYQELHDAREPVSGGYVLLAENRVGFELGAYDSSRELVIDPVVVYSGYFGMEDEGRASVVVADDGSAIVAGRTGDDVAVFKLNPAGSAVDYVTVLGGAGEEAPTCRGSALAVDAAGDVYVAGETTSSNFPTTGGAFDRDFNGDIDSFVVRLDAAGMISYSTYLGGSGEDGDLCIALGPDGDVYVASESDSDDFPTTPGAYDLTRDAERDITVSRLRLAGQGADDLLYSTFVGGSAEDRCPSLAVDESGFVYVVAESNLPSTFPTTPGAFDASHNGERDLVAFKLNPAGQGAMDLLYSTYFGGSGVDERAANANGIAVDVAGDIYITGETDSENVPIPTTPNAFDDTFNGENDFFIAKLRLGSQGAADLVFSTMIGGSGLDESVGVFVDEARLVYFAGDTDSERVRFPVVNPLQPRFAGGSSDVVFGVLSPDGSELLFSTYFGGSGFDCCPDLFVDNSGRLTVVGETDSANFPTTTGAFDTTLQGEDDLFVTRVGELGVRMFTVSNASGLRPELAAETIVSGFGQGLSGQTLVVTELPLPVELGGVSVPVIDSAGAEWSAPLFFVSASQINYLIPAGAALGWAQVEVIRDGQVVARDGIQVTAVSPGIFTANSTGSGPPLATFLRANADGSRDDGLVFDAAQPQGQRTALALDLGGEGDQVFLILFGTGLRGATSATATIDGVPVALAGPVALQQFVGLDQFNLGPLPRSLIGRGEVQVVVTFDDTQANIVTIRIQ